MFDEGAVAAVAGDDGGDEWISRNGRVLERPNRDKGIVLSRQNQCRYANAIDDPHRTGAVIVISGIAKPVMGGRVRFVELTDRPDSPQRVQREHARDGRRLATHPGLESSHEVPLVGQVRAALQRIHAHRQVHRRRHRADGLQFAWRLIAEVAGQLERQIATQRIARNREGANPVADDQFAQDEKRIVGQPRVVQTAREVLGIPAVALVQSDDVPAARPCLVCHPSHVMGEAGAFQSMQ